MQTRRQFVKTVPILGTGQIAHGPNARQAAEQVFMPDNLRGDWENYGQVESHVRQVYNGTMGWFGGDVYDINPLSGNEEAARTVQLMGGPAAVQKAATSANAQGGLDNWRWTLKLTSLLLELDPANAEARKLRAAASRQLGQITSSTPCTTISISVAIRVRVSKPTNPSCSLRLTEIQATK